MRRDFVGYSGRKSFPFSARKGKMKGKKGKFLGISGDFAGISCEEIPSLFSEKGKLKGKRENAEGWLICLIGV